MNQLGGFPLLSLVVFLPALGAVISLFVRRERHESLRWLALLIAATNVFVTLFLYMGWIHDPSGGAQFVDGPWPWIASIGMYYHLGVDGISLHLVLLTTLLTLLAMIVAWTTDTDAEHLKETTFWMLILETSLLGAYTALNPALLALFWLGVLVAAFFMTGLDTANPRAAAHALAGGALAAVCLIATVIGLSITTAGLDQTGSQAWIFWVAAIACGATGAIFPLHLWYPPAQRHASMTTQVLIGGLVLNLGSYGLIRLCLTLLPSAAAGFAPAILVLSTIGLLYGALGALGQRDLSGTLAYWRIAQSSLTAIGVFSMQNLGLHGAVIHMTGCGLTTAGLLLQSGGRGRRTEQTEGNRSASPGTRAAVALALLSGIGLPGTIGFTGQTTLLMGLMRWRWQPLGRGTASYTLDWAWVALIALGLLLGAWALVRAWRHIVAEPAGMRIALPILFLILLFGVLPTLASDTIGPTVRRVLGQVQEHGSSQGVGANPCPWRDTGDGRPPGQVLREDLTLPQATGKPQGHIETGRALTSYSTQTKGLASTLFATRDEGTGAYPLPPQCLLEMTAPPCYAAPGPLAAGTVEQRERRA